jgi:hypothetical protein
MAPLLVALCRRKSTRLTAVVGGLVMALAVLFASFARHFHQVFLRSDNRTLLRKGAFVKWGGCIEETQVK